MKRIAQSIVRGLVPLGVLWIALGFSGATRADGPLCCLPADTMRFRVAFGTSSFIDTTLSTLPPDYSVTNGLYSSWCVDYDTDIGPGTLYSGHLFDPYGGNLPPVIQFSPWPKIIYILNHKQGSIQDIQNAIWVALGQSFDPPFTVAAAQMVNDANQFGATFVPTNGQMAGVLIEPNPAPQTMAPVQRLLIEVANSSSCDETNAPTEVMLQSMEWVANTGFRLQLAAQTGHCFLIESSTNLINWAPLRTVIRTNATVSFTDTNAPGLGHRFYRARHL